MTEDRPPADDPLGTLLFEMTVVGDSTSPLQLISGELLEYYRRCEADLITIRASLPICKAAECVCNPPPPQA